MLNLILLALYIAPILAVLFLEQKKPTEALLWMLVMCDFIANLATPRRMFQPLVEAGGKVIRIQPPPCSYEEFLYRGRKEKFSGCVFLPFAPLM